MPILSKFSPPKNLLWLLKDVFFLQKRGSHARTLVLRGGKTQAKRIFDLLHFYFLGGVIVFGGFCFTLNLLYGPCELTETPEGYEPRHWEYEERPIQQLMQRYFNCSEIKKYEKNLGEFEESQKRWKWKLQEERIHHVMYERADYKAWYYIPYVAKWSKFSERVVDKVTSNREPFYQFKHD